MTEPVQIIRLTPEAREKKQQYWERVDDVEIHVTGQKQVAIPRLTSRMSEKIRERIIEVTQGIPTPTPPDLLDVLQGLSNEQKQAIESSQLIDQKYSEIRGMELERLQEMAGQLGFSLTPANEAVAFVDRDEVKQNRPVEEKSDDWSKGWGDEEKPADSPTTPKRGGRKASS